MSILHLTPDDDDHRSPCGLLVDTAKGDREAYAALFSQIAPRVIGVCQRVVGDPARSEEVAQDVLIEVWRSARRFDPDRGCAMPWILTIAHRRSADRVGEAVERRQDHERVRAALEHLTPEQREVIDLTYFGGHTHREVAELLDVPSGTVATRIRDGLTRLGDLADQPRTASHATVTLR